MAKTSFYADSAPLLDPNPPFISSPLAPTGACGNFAFRAVAFG